MSNLHLNIPFVQRSLSCKINAGIGIKIKIFRSCTLWHQIAEGAGDRFKEISVLVVVPELELP